MSTRSLGGRFLELLPRFEEVHFYATPIPQSSWAKHPAHVTISTTLYTDLCMNEFLLARLSAGVAGVWIPIAVFFAVYDVWETRVVFDSLFRLQDDLFHHALGTLAWLILALMATTIAPEPQWPHFDSLFFASLKAAHSFIRLFMYLETHLYSTSRRARLAAFSRCVVFGCGVPFYIAPPICIALGVASTNVLAGLWVAGFVTQRVVFSAIHLGHGTRFALDRHMNKVKTNVPFLTSRYGDWLMLQLGAAVLGLMTIPLTGTSSFATLVFSYLYVASVNLLEYSMTPSDPNDHALVRGGIHELAWHNLFTIGGVALLGIAVGLRVLLFYPELVILPQNHHYIYTYGVCAMVLTQVMLLQELTHGGTIARVHGGKVWTLKFFFTGLYAAVAGGFIASGNQTVSHCNLGFAVVSLIILLFQVLHGSFRRELVHARHVRLMGAFYAALIGRILLYRARLRLRSNGSEADTSSAPDRRISATVSLVPLDTNSVSTGLAEPLESAGPLPMTSSSDGALLHPHSSLAARARRLSLQTAVRAVATEVKVLRRLSIGETVKAVANEAQIIRHVINDRFYARPQPYVGGETLVKYTLQWSDLFFDVLYVGVVFRLGDLLLAGIGAGFAETTVLYQLLLGGNVTRASPYKDPVQNDAVWIFASVFIAAWSMWQSKLAFSSKISTPDVAHKFMDLFQGLCVLVCAVNISTPTLMQDSSTGNAYFVTSALMFFHGSMLLQWIEVYLTSDSKDTKVKATAGRNVVRDASTLVPLIISYGTIYLEAPLSVTTLLWSMCWFLPFLLRIAKLRRADVNSVRDLHRYVIHRLGDGALIVLGEGVLQIIRTKTYPEFSHYASVILAFFIMTAVRIAVFSLDCFREPEKHAQLLSIRAGLAASLIRNISAPALVAIGMGLKKIISLSQRPYELADAAFYWLLCGSSLVALASLVITYELHRFAFHGSMRRYGLAICVFYSFAFLLWPWLAIPGWALLALCLGTWFLGVFLHYAFDDYYARRTRAATSAMPSFNHSTRRMRKNRTGGVSMHALILEDQQNDLERATRKAAKRVERQEKGGVFSRISLLASIKLTGADQPNPTPGSGASLLEAATLHTSPEPPQMVNSDENFRGGAPTMHAAEWESDALEAANPLFNPESPN